jgi:hypothetical protein
LEDVVDLLERSESVNMHMLGIVDKSRTEVITAQQKVEKLQELRFLQSNFTSTVQNTVQKVIRTYGEAVKSATTKSSICEESIKTIVHDVIEKEDWSKNLIIHGLKEDTSDHLSDRVSCLFEELGEKPKVKFAGLVE